MRIEDILKKWIEYTDFDPDRKKFNLLSAEYEFHKISKKMTDISQFDPSGTLAVLYAKNKFEQFTEHAKVPLRTILEEPDSLRESSEMWSMLHSAEVRSLEDGRKRVGENSGYGSRKRLCVIAAGREAGRICTGRRLDDCVRKEGIV